METWGLSDPNLQSQIAVKLFRLSYVAESHIMMTGKKHENEVGRGNHLSSFLKITIFLGKKMWLSLENTSSNGQVLSHIKMKHFPNSATGLSA